MAKLIVKHGREELTAGNCANCAMDEMLRGTLIIVPKAAKNEVFECLFKSGS